MRHAIRQRIPWTRSLLAVFAALFVTACSGGKPPTIAACALISTQEAGAALGATVTEKALNEPTASPDRASMCHYGTGKVNEGFLLLAAPMREGTTAHAIASDKTSITDDLRANLGIKPTIRDIAGLGDTAFVVETPAFVQLHVYTGRAKLVINMNGPQTERNVTLAKKLASIAIGHLP